VRELIVENALMWLRDYHVDGLRLDAVHALHESGEQPVHILQEIAERADALSAHVGRPLTLIAESDLNDPVMFLPREAGGYGLAAQWSDDWHHAVHVALTGETVGYYKDFGDPEALPKVWTEGFFHNGTYSSFRERDHGEPVPDEAASWRLVTYAQDHDQIGNRAAGDRLTATLSADRLAIAAVLTLTAPGTPMLFMGEEWGASTPWQFFTSHPEPELAEATAKGRIAEFVKMGWDESIVPLPNDRATFERSKLDWDEREQGEHGRLLDLYRSLARLRRERPQLTDPGPGGRDAEVEVRGSGRRYVLRRRDVRIVVNLTDEPWEVAGGDVWIATREPDAAGESLVIAPESAVVIGR